MLIKSTGCSDAVVGIALLSLNLYAFSSFCTVFSFSNVFHVVVCLAKRLAVFYCHLSSKTGR